MSEFKSIVGKKIVSLRGNQNCLNFFDDEGNGYGFYAEGDCCSSSWFEHMDNPEAIVGATIISVEDVAMNDISQEEHDEHGYDCLAQYGFKFTTTKGTCTLEMRNNSNGYYGGYVSNMETNEDYPEIKEAF